MAIPVPARALSPTSPARAAHGPRGRTGPRAELNGHQLVTSRASCHCLMRLLTLDHNYDSADRQNLPAGRRPAGAPADADVAGSRAPCVHEHRGVRACVAVRVVVFVCVPACVVVCVPVRGCACAAVRAVAGPGRPGPGPARGPGGDSGPTLRRTRRARPGAKLELSSGCQPTECGCLSY